MYDDMMALNIELKQLKKENRLLKRELNEKEQVINFIGNSHTLQKNIYEMTKQEIARKNTYIQLMFDYTPDIIILIDKDEKLINVTKNSLERYGVVIESFSDKSARDVMKPFFLPEQNEANARAVEEVVQKGVVKKFDKLKLTILNQPYIFDVSVIPLRDHTDEIIGAMMTMHDVTEYHHALELAKRASDAKSSFLAKVSHEVRTPMNTILGLSELTLRDELNKEQREHVIGIKHAGEHLVSIINDILDFSKIESGMMEIIPADYTLSDLLDYAIEIIRMKVIDLPILFIANVESNIPEFLIGDEMRVRQMLLNLLSNSCKYCEKGFVKLTVNHVIVDQETIMLCLEVEDTGIGIKEKNIGKLFGDFVQLGEAVGEKEVEGTGLGLAITRGFAVAMGGDITVESEHGVGSTFKISIPQKINTAKMAKDSYGGVFARVDDVHKSLSILIYETREVYAHSLVESINSLGIGCSLATAQSDFIVAVKQKSYDFVFVSSFSYDGAKKVFKKLGIENVKLVLIAEYGEIAIETDSTKTLTMPAHTADIADILTKRSRVRDAQKSEDGSRFVAPTARALVVDDINTNLIVAQGLLSPYKMAVDICKSGKEAIELVQKNDYDIIFMDHMMPEMDGIEATAKIRALVPPPESKRTSEYYKTLPFVALTANAVSGMKEMFLKNNFDDFLAKPIDVSILDSILERWLPENKLDTFMVKEENDVEKGLDLPMFRIEGVDVENGIYMTGGDSGNYLKTLGIFREDGIEKVEAIRQCVESQDLQLYAIHVHALKSASASIGAAKVSNLARSLEVAAKNKDISYIIKHNEKFLEELVMLLESIKIAMASQSASVAKAAEAKGAVDVKLIAELSRKLRQAIDIFDMEEVDAVLIKLREETQGKTLKIVESISNNILICEYDRANELAERLEQSC
jgi:signal transduction histidine kinase/HPt (histidine-containing phosphotransfer) domain-containing protein/FixJ family two-component response regulator